MRSVFCLLLLAGFSLTAFAANGMATSKVTVAQLEQMLAADHAASDGDVADQLFGLQLTERLSAARFARLKAGLPGEKARQALLALADASQFQKLPAAEIPSAATPTPVTQRQMMDLVVSYVTTTLHRLPNFLATRETTHFEDRPPIIFTGILVANSMPLHFTGKSSQPVIYRDGQEQADTDARKHGTPQSESQGLVTRGEFGPILSTVLLDAAQSRLVWSHWEEGADGLEAVFSYTVPAQQSHYYLHASGIVDGSLFSHEFHELAGYHGEIAVDPASGAILRLTLEADPAPDDPFIRSAILVNYGAVELGGKHFICPVKSVALSLYRSASTTAAPHASSQAPVKTYLNDVAFEQYHRLGSEVHILTVDQVEAATDSPASVAGIAAPPAASEAAPAPEPEPAPHPAPVAQPPVAASSTAPAATAPAATAPAPSTASDHTAPEPNPRSDPLRPLLVRGMHASTQIAFSVGALPANPQPAQDAKPAGGEVKPLTRYLVDFNVRAKDVNLTLTPEGNYGGKLHFELVAYERYGTALKWAGGTLVLDLSPESYAEAQSSGIPAHLEIDLPDTVIFLEAGVFDWTTRKVGTQEILIRSTEPMKAR
ncbi:MAG TPA: hypothetical protein VKG86_09440 [Terracidiphilus sp.]|nr:hypothetical protein [Terracidiphilus sp.]